MHRNTKRLASALLAAALCLLLVPQAGADYEPWTYEVDDVMSTYGVEYYADVGFENPTRTADQTAAGAGASGGISTYSAGAGAAVDTGRGYTTRQLPGGITLYSPTQSGISTYALDDGVATQITIVPNPSYDKNTNTTTGKEIINGEPAYTTYSVTIPATVELEPGKTSTLTVTGQVSSRSELTINVNGFDAGETANRQLKLKNGTETLDYTITRGSLGISDSASRTNLTPVAWGGTMESGKATKYFLGTLTAELDESNTYNISGEYEDTITFTMEGHRKLFTVNYHANMGEATETTASDQYAIGGTDKLPGVSCLNVTAPENKKFIGWSAWQTASEGKTNNVYEAGLMFGSIEESAIKSIYASLDKNPTLELYAQWQSTDITNISANVYVEKNTLSRSAETGIAGSGAYMHNEAAENYEQTYGSDATTQAALQLTGISVQAGLTYRWSLAELENYVDADTKAKLEAQKDYIDQQYAARVVISTDGKSADIYINRNLICLDLNAKIYYLDEDGNVQSRKYTVSGSLGTATDPCGEAYVILDVANRELQNDSKRDCWSIVPYGSKITLKVRAVGNYNLTGYVLSSYSGIEQTEWDETAVDEAGNEFKVVKFSVTPASGNKAYTVQAVFQQQPQATLLPTSDEMKPVVVDMPAADTTTLDDVSAAPETTQAADTTPDDLRIMDADEMLAEFALQDAQPVW